MGKISKNNKIRLINIQCIALIAVAFILVFALPDAHAWLGDDNKTAKAMATVILTGPLKMISDVIADTGDSPLHGLYEAATGALPSSMVPLETGFKVLGGILAMIIGISHMLENIQREQEPMEAIWKGIVEIFVTFLILINMTEIMDKLSEFGSAIVGDIATAGAEQVFGDSNALQLLKDLTGEETGGPIWRAEAFCALIIPYALTQLINIAAKFAIIQVLLEIVIRRTFAPLAVVDIYREGLRSPGMRYLKRFLGAYLKVAICAAVAILVPDLVGATGGSGSADEAIEYMFSIIAINFTAIAIMLKAGEYTNDIVGA